MDTSEAPEIRIRAIAELHRIEMSLHTIFQELPHEQFQIKPQIQREPTNCDCMSRGTITHSKCRYCKQVWCPLTLKQDWCPNPECGQGIKGSNFEPWDEHNKWINCASCRLWFKNNDILAVHNCYVKAVPAVDNDDLPGPGIGGEGAGPITEQPSGQFTTTVDPNPIIITPHSFPIEEQEPEEEHEETESERYWRMNPVKKNNINEIHYPRRHQEDDD